MRFVDDEVIAALDAVTERRREQWRRWTATSRARETPEAREKRLARARAWWRAHREKAPERRRRA